MLPRSSGAGCLSAGRDSTPGSLPAFDGGPQLRCSGLSRRSARAEALRLIDAQVALPEPAGRVSGQTVQVRRRLTGKFNYPSESQ
eukprot:1611180-Rhodomonas_salina.2